MKPPFYGGIELLLAFCSPLDLVHKRVVEPGYEDSKKKNLKRNHLDFHECRMEIEALALEYFGEIRARKKIEHTHPLSPGG